MSGEGKHRIQCSKSVDLSAFVGNFGILGANVGTTSRSLNTYPFRVPSPSGSEDNTPRSILGLIKNRSLSKISPKLSARNSHYSTSVDPTQVLFHEKVGAGGSADIFSGSVSGLGLAIKCYRQPISDDPLDDDLMHEILICKDLTHPRIISYIGFSIENQFSDRKLMMLMELCRETVHQLIPPC